MSSLKLANQCVNVCECVCVCARARARASSARDTSWTRTTLDGIKIENKSNTPPPSHQPPNLGFHQFGHGIIILEPPPQPSISKNMGLWYFIVLDSESQSKSPFPSPPAQYEIRKRDQNGQNALVIQFGAALLITLIYPKISKKRVKIWSNNEQYFH